MRRKQRVVVDVVVVQMQMMQMMQMMQPLLPPRTRLRRMGRAAALRLGLERGIE